MAERWRLKVGDKFLVHSAAHLTGLVKFNAQGGVELNQESSSYLPEEFTVAGIYSMGKSDFDRIVFFADPTDAADLFDRTERRIVRDASLAVLDRIKDVVDHIVEQMFFIGEKDIDGLFAAVQFRGQIIHRESQAFSVKKADGGVQNLFSDVFGHERSPVFEETKMHKMVSMRNVSYKHMSTQETICIKIVSTARQFTQKRHPAFAGCLQDA